MNDHQQNPLDTPSNQSILTHGLQNIEVKVKVKLMELYDLQLIIEELNDGGDYRYVASSPDLPNLLVAGDTIDEVLALAPQVATVLITSMKAAGDKLPNTVRHASALPFTSRLMVAA